MGVEGSGNDGICRTSLEWSMKCLRYIRNALSVRSAVCSLDGCRSLCGDAVTEDFAGDFKGLFPALLDEDGVLGTKVAAGLVFAAVLIVFVGTCDAGPKGMTKGTVSE